MKVTTCLTYNFDDYDDKRIHKHLLNGMDYFFALKGVLDELRKRIKYSDNFVNGDARTAQDIRDFIITDLEERGIHLNDI